MREHLLDVFKILHEATLDLRKRLGIEVEVTDLDIGVLEHKRAALSPARKPWYEVRRGDQLNVDSESVLQLRQFAPPVRYTVTGN